MTLQNCIDEAVTRGVEDWVPVPEIAWIARDIGGATSEGEVRDLSLDIIRELVGQALMEIGNMPTAPGSRRLLIWPGSPSKWVDRMQSEWRALGRHPVLGELGWLQNTAKGDEIGNRLLDQRQRSGRTETS